MNAFVCLDLTKLQLSKLVGTGKLDALNYYVGYEAALYSLCTHPHKGYPGKLILSARTLLFYTHAASFHFSLSNNIIFLASQNHDVSISEGTGGMDTSMSPVPHRQGRRSQQNIDKDPAFLPLPSQIRDEEDTSNIMREIQDIEEAEGQQDPADMLCKEMETMQMSPEGSRLELDALLTEVEAIQVGRKSSAIEHQISVVQTDVIKLNATNFGTEVSISTISAQPCFLCLLLQLRYCIVS